MDNDNNPAGKAAWAANLAVTAAIHNGTASQPLLTSFAQAQEQALRDAFINIANVTELADGLGSKLGGAYQALGGCTSTDDGLHAACDFKIPEINTLFGATTKLTVTDAAAGKYFFSNLTTDGKKPVSPEAAAILKQTGGTTDVFGKAYKDPAGSANAGPYGNARPFQTEDSKTFITYTATDYFGKSDSNTLYLDGPLQKLKTSPAFPSGHTTYGYTNAVLLAILVPERYPQMITRGAEYGNSRIIVGAHYAMDVIGGRTIALYDIAHLLAKNPAALQPARTALNKTLAAGCGGTVAACAKTDTSRFNNPAANEAFYESTQTYGMPVVYLATAAKTETVAVVAPEAGYLLTTAFPYLTLAKADHILTETEGAGGGFLDNGSAFGLYSRLDLYKASVMAESLAPKPK